MGHFPFKNGNFSVKRTNFLCKKGHSFVKKKEHTFLLNGVLFFKKGYFI